MSDTPNQTSPPEHAEQAPELADDLLDLLASVEKVSGPDLFDHAGSTVPKSDGASIENPPLAHSLYHGTIEALLRKHLPKLNSKVEAERKVAKEIRRLKNLYLNDGEKKGADSKMSYNHRKAAVASEIIGWLEEYGGGNFAALHGRLVRLCVDAGLKV